VAQEIGPVDVQSGQQFQQLARGLGTAIPGLQAVADVSLLRDQEAFRLGQQQELIGEPLFGDESDPRVNGWHNRRGLADAQALKLKMQDFVSKTRNIRTPEELQVAQDEWNEISQESAANAQGNRFYLEAFAPRARELELQVEGHLANQMRKGRQLDAENDVAAGATDVVETALKGFIEKNDLELDFMGRDVGELQKFYADIEDGSIPAPDFVSIASVLRDEWTRMQLQAKEEGVDKNRITQIFVQQVGTLANKYRMPELLDVFDLPDPDGFNIFTDKTKTPAQGLLAAKIEAYRAQATAARADLEQEVSQKTEKERREANDALVTRGILMSSSVMSFAEALRDNDQFTVAEKDVQMKAVVDDMRVQLDAILSEPTLDGPSSRALSILRANLGKFEDANLEDPDFAEGLRRSIMIDGPTAFNRRKIIENQHNLSTGSLGAILKQFEAASSVEGQKDEVAFKGFESSTVRIETDELFQDVFDQRDLLGFAGPQAEATDVIAQLGFGAGTSARKVVSEFQQLLTERRLDPRNLRNELAAWRFENLDKDTGRFPDIESTKAKWEEIKSNYRTRVQSAISASGPDVRAVQAREEQQALLTKRVNSEITGLPSVSTILGRPFEERTLQGLTQSETAELLQDFTTDKNITDLNRGQRSALVVRLFNNAKDIDAFAELVKEAQEAKGDDRDIREVIPLDPEEFRAEAQAFTIGKGSEPRVTAISEETLERIPVESLPIFQKNRIIEWVIDDFIAKAEKKLGVGKGKLSGTQKRFLEDYIRSNNLSALSRIVMSEEESDTQLEFLMKSSMFGLGPILDPNQFTNPEAREEFFKTPVFEPEVLPQGEDQPII
jgi:hypothetical protein